MNEFLDNYYLTSVSIVGLLVLYFIQVIVADLAQDKAGHTPGKVFEGAHDNFTFRAIRAPANSLENIPFMVFFSMMGVLLLAPVMLTNVLAALCFLFRLSHMSAYYLDYRYVRGYSWILGMVVMLVMIGNCVYALFIA